ncbi:MAG: DsrE family protein [Thermomicrobiales bacterium]
MTHGSSRRTVIGGLGAAMTAAALPAAALAQGTPAADAAQVRVVFHVASPDHWDYALSNLDNLLKAAPDGAYQVVTDGTAVYVLAGANDIVAHLGRLSEAGVFIRVCPNALAEHAIDVSELPAWMNTELGGVLALVEANRAGYVYVKP